MKRNENEQVIESSDVGVLDLKQETVEPVESVPTSEVEPVAVEMGKTPGALKPKFMSLYKVLSNFGDTVDHGKSSRRHHFKVGRKGYSLMFYGLKPKLQLCHVVEGSKKKQFTTYSITGKGVVDADGNPLTIKEIQKTIRAYKKAKGI